LQTALHAGHGALDAHGDPGVEVNDSEQAIVLAGALQATVGDETVGIGSVQLVGALANRCAAPEFVTHRAGLLVHA
jgi:hypothetical protein